MKYVKHLSLLLLLPVFFSCNKFLEKNPDARAELNTAEKVSKLLTSAYPNASFASFAETMSDNAGDKPKIGVDIAQLAAYTWSDLLDDSQDTPENYWSSSYAAIASANQALEACNNAVNPADYAAQKGEALVCRAYAHFMLVNFFSKSFDATTAASDPGIPYVTEPETVVFKKYSRGTVKEVYEKAEKDLLEGLPLLNDQKYTVPKYHFTKKAAYAFATRFFLFKKEYQKAVDYASLAFPNNSFIPSMRKWQTTYKAYTFNELVQNYTRAIDPANLLLVEAGSLYARTYATRRFGWNTQIRGETLRSPNAAGTVSWIYSLYLYSQDDYFIPKWKEFFAESFPGAGYGLPYIMVPLFTTEEVLFNRAEAYAQLGKFSEAIADVNTFCSQRFTNYNAATQGITLAKSKAFYNTADDKQAMINTILDMKRPEFLFEGLRWFDVCRNRLTVTHSFSDGGTPAQTITLINTPDDKNRLLQLPQSVTLSGLELNPR
ncbi:MAG: RagB/SusD family nutrient uptake outer membrane protein [Chitinophagaceae bacterium]